MLYFFAFTHGIYNYILHTNCVYGTQCCSCSVFTVYATCNVISPVKYVLYFSFSIFHSLCAVHNIAVFCNTLVSCFPGMLLRYCLSDLEMVQVFLLLPVSLLFHIPHALNFYCKVFVYYNHLYFFHVHISVCMNCNIYWHACSLLSIRKYAIRYIVGNSYVDLLCWFHSTVILSYYIVQGHTTVRCTIFPHFPTHVTVQFSTRCIMSLYVLSFPQYWTCRYDVFHCLIKLFTVCICSLFLFVLFLSHDIWFAIPDLVLLLFHFQSLLSDLPATAIKRVFSTNKLSIQTSNTLAMQYFAFPFYLYRTSYFSFACWMPSFVVSFLSDDWFDYSAKFAALSFFI